MNDRSTKKVVRARVYKLELLEKRYALSADGFECDEANNNAEFERIQRDSDRAVEIRALQSRYPTLERELSRLESKSHREDRQEPRQGRDQQNSTRHSQLELTRIRGQRAKRTSSHASSTLASSILIPSGSPEGESITLPPTGSESILTSVNQPTSNSNTFDVIGNAGTIPVGTPPGATNLFPPPGSPSPGDISRSTRPEQPSVNSPSVSPSTTTETAVTPGTEEVISESVGEQIDRANAAAESPELSNAERSDLIDASASVQLTSIVSREDVRITNESERANAIGEFLSARAEEGELVDAYFEGDSIDARQSLESHQTRFAKDLTELDELLNDLAIARQTANDQAARFRETAVPNDVTGDPNQVLNRPAGEMILLEAGLNARASTAADAIEQLTPSNVVQWSVGIGFYRALELAGESGLANPADAQNATRSAEGEAEMLRPEYDDASAATLSTHRGLSAVFCVLGIQYLRRRHKFTGNETLPTRRRWRLK
ncbi:MAG: hypothetical protein ACR2NZ_05070 [Rubripirellula sp.]